ncbi:Nuclear Rna Export Factor 3 [Manis pentadactyla]|nr:Nuclear Rna Export Factor 3 [Manis pentadactyla]
MEGKSQDEASGNWFKIEIPFGIKYDEKWLLKLIQKQCRAPSLQSSLTIWADDNERINIFVKPREAPHSLQKELKSEKVGVHQADHGQAIWCLATISQCPKTPL